MKLVVLGLSLSSSWGNGHATTFRALLRAFAERGHDILFLERDVPWYAAQRDLPDPEYCELVLYEDLAGLAAHAGRIASADAVMVGSYVPEGVEVGRMVQDWASGVTAFYDIDTPVTLAKLAAGDYEYLTPGLIPGYDLYLSFTGGPTLDLIETRYGSPAARALYCSVDPAAYPPLDLPKRWDLTYLGTYSPDRQPTLERLLIETARRLPDRRFAVAGPQYPGDIDWPANVDRIEHLPPAEHAAFYASSRFTLNVTRADMIKAGWSPSVRLFEAAACGTPVISDRWPGIGDIFMPPQEIILAENADDVIAALDTADAEAIGGRARARILAAHTSDHRAAQLEIHLEDALATHLNRMADTQGISPMTDASRNLILVAGGAGFIGFHLCSRLLEEGYDVLCVDNLLTARPDNLDLLCEYKGFTFVEADITEPLPRAVLTRGPRISRIYNLACAASPPRYQADPEHTMLTNVVGTSALLQLAEQNGARFLLASTSEVYGDPENHPQREDYRGWVSCTGPRACYDEGKRAAEAITFDYTRMKRADVRVARIFNTYGPMMHPDDGRVVSNLICQALSGDSITIYGDGQQTRSFCYVSDLVDGLIRLMESDIDGTEPVNLGNPEELTVRELADLICDLTGFDQDIVHLPLPRDDPRRRRPDIGRAQSWLGWEPRVPVREGLARTAEWFATALGTHRVETREDVAVAAE